MYTNYQNEKLSFDKNLAKKQLENLLKKGYDYIIFSSAVNFDSEGFDSCEAYTEEEYRLRKKEEWLEEISESDFEEWLNDDCDELYKSIQVLLEEIDSL